MKISKVELAIQSGKNTYIVRIEKGRVITTDNLNLPQNVELKAAVVDVVKVLEWVLKNDH